MEVSTEQLASQCETHGDYFANGVKVGRKTIWMGCPTCADELKTKNDAEARSAEAADKQRRIESRLDCAGIPLRFRSKDFASYIADTDEKSKARAVAMEFANNFKDHRGAGTVAIFSGKPGTGKSHLALAIASEILSSYTAMYISAIDAVRMVRDTWRRDSPQTETQVLQMLASIDLLVLDEVGVQYGTESEQVTLFDIIDKRYRDQMPMILLTNLTASEMKLFLGDRSYDRLREGGKWVKFDWESQRGKVSV